MERRWPSVPTPLARSGLVGLGHDASVDATRKAAAASPTAAASALPSHALQRFPMLPEVYHIFTEHVIPQSAFQNPLGHAPSTATGAHAMPIQPIVDAAPRHDPHDAHVLESSSSQSQIDSLLAAYACAIASHQSQIDKLKEALCVLGQRFTDSQTPAVQAGRAAGSAHPAHESPSKGPMTRPTQLFSTK